MREKSHLNFGMYITSKNEDADRDYCQLCLHWMDTYKYFKLPDILKPKVIIVENTYMPEKYGTTRNEYIEQRYGFSVYEECFWINHGNYTHDSSTEQQTSFNLGWRDYTFVRWSGYDPQHNLIGHFENGSERLDWPHVEKLRESLPKVQIQFNDYDGEEIVATCYIQEREWYVGRGWFAWLKYFNKPLIRRTIDISFNKETGDRKGSWKGGTIGTGEDMSPNETVFEAFLRYATKHNFTNLKEL